MIALIYDREPRLWRDALARWGPVRAFQDGVTLARYLQRDGPCSLAVVAADGAAGMNWTSYVKRARPALRVLWVTEQEAFRPQSRRIGAEGFLARPLPRGEPEETLTRLLGPPGEGGQRRSLKNQTAGRVPAEDHSIG